MNNSQQHLDMEKNHPPIQSLFKGENKRIYQANSSRQTLKKVENDSADLTELQQIAAQIPPEYFKSKPLSPADLPSYFDLNNLTGQKICVAFIPLLDQGDSLDDMDEKETQDFFSGKIFFKTLFVNTNAQNLTDGFGNEKGFFFDLLPMEMQADLSDGGTTFTISQKFGNSEDARRWYAGNYNLAMANLLRLLMVVK
jgi:hypothetical protein